MLFRNRFFQLLGGGRLERLGIGIVSRVQLLALGAHKEKETLRRIKKMRRERKSLLTAFESFLVYSLARAQRKRPGAYAEVGVFDGGSAKMLCEGKGERPLHLFDTFAGLPKGVEHDRRVHREHQYASSLDSVREYLSGFENVWFHPGLFPESAADVEETQYALVHFDVDLYQSTLDCLDYFYPKMVPGGIMLSHDFSILAGVQQAFHEFLEDKPEELIELPTTQCMVIKL